MTYGYGGKNVAHNSEYVDKDISQESLELQNVKITGQSIDEKMILNGDIVKVDPDTIHTY